MADWPPVIDADGHVLERQSDIRKYLEPPWNAATRVSGRLISRLTLTSSIPSAITRYDRCGIKQLCR